MLMEVLSFADNRSFTGGSHRDNYFIVLQRAPFARAGI